MQYPPLHRKKLDFDWDLKVGAAITSHHETGLVSASTLIKEEREGAVEFFVW